jgi:hypothetical protein
MADVTLTQAAAQLGRSYNQVLRLVLLGELRGRQRDGRWTVSRESVESLLSKRNNTAGAANRDGREI